jgi:hypothetical protein
MKCVKEQLAHKESVEATLLDRGDVDESKKRSFQLVNNPLFD